MRRWSKSSYLTFRLCPYKWKLKYIDNIKVDIPQRMKDGIILHELFNTFYDYYDSTYYDKNAIILASKDLKLSNAFLNKYDNEINNFLMFNKELLNKYNITKPSFRELKVINNDWVGFIDRVDIVKDKNVILLTDYKTQSNPSHISKYMEELVIYSKLLFMTQNILPNKVGIYFSHTNDFVTRDLTKQDIEEYFRNIKIEINVYEEAIKNKLFVRHINPFCKTCEYKDICKPEEYLNNMIKENEKKHDISIDNNYINYKEFVPLKNTIKGD